MGKDIKILLRDWVYNPTGLQVRKIIGDDGLEKIQMRIDLGMLQFEIDGRPDGDRPKT